MTLNGVMAVILRYFSEFAVYDVAVKQLLGLLPFISTLTKRKRSTYNNVIYKL